MKSAFSIKEVVNVGWEKTKKHFWFLIGVELFVAVIILGLSFIAQAIGATTAFFVNLFSGILQIIFGIGFIYIALTILSDQTPTFQMLFSKFRLFWKYIGTNICSGALVVTPVLIGFAPYAIFTAFGVTSQIINILLGIFALVGIILAIVISIRLQFATYFVVSEMHGPLVSIKESLRGTRGEIWKLFLLVIVLLLINFIGILGLGIGLLVTIPISKLAITATFKKLAASR